MNQLTINENTTQTVIEFTPKNQTITVKKNGKLNLFSCYINEEVEENHNIILEENATVDFYIIFLGKEQQKFTLAGTCFHQGSNSKSNMVVKGILLDSAQASFSGLVKITKKATNCEGYQQEHALLLGEKSKATLVPNLEIENDNVKCSHGATIGKIDQEQLFYLSSRGIQKEIATQMLIEGFFEEIITQLPEKEQQKVRGKLHA